MLRLPLCTAVVAIAWSAAPAVAQRASAPAVAQRASAPTVAQPRLRYVRTQPTPPPVVLSDRVKPVQPGPVSSTAPKPRIELTSVLPVDAFARTSRPDQEPILVALIEHTPDSEPEEKSDYYFRLATYYGREVRWWTAKAAELGAAASSAREAAQARDRAKTNLLKAVKVFKGLTDNDAFRNYPKLDVALFAYGYTLQTGKYMKEARAVYDKLLKNFPNSQYVPYAHLVFGEFYFDSGQLADAEARYKFVLRFPKSDAYWYAMYKLGWIHMQLQRNQEALETFAQVVFATRSDAKAKAIHDAATHDFVLAYAQIGKADKAFDAFTRIDKDGAAELVEALADAARQQGAGDKAVAAYRQLVARLPNDSRACRWQYQLAHSLLYVPAATTDDKVHAIAALAATYAQARAAAIAAGGQGADADPECRANTAAMTGELAAAYYAEWSKTHNPETLASAEQLYAAFTSAFPGATPQQLTYAEVLWSRADLETDPKLRPERWQRAAEAFTAGATGADAARMADAPRAAALAALNALELIAPTTAPKLATHSPATAPRALPLSPRDATLLAAFTGYLALQPPADDEVAQVRLAAATLLRRYKHFEEATTILDKFLAEHADHASAELAALLLLDSMVQARSADLPDVVAAMTADLTFITRKPALLRQLQRLTAASSRSRR